MMDQLKKPGVFTRFVEITMHRGMVFSLLNGECTGKFPIPQIMRNYFRKTGLRIVSPKINEYETNRGYQ